MMAQREGDGEMGKEGEKGFVMARYQWRRLVSRTSGASCWVGGNIWEWWRL